jgi:diguanylate cyclase (GGDEF)-like protein
MEARRRNPLEIRPHGRARLVVAVAYVGLYLLTALWGRKLATHPGPIPGVAPWFPAAGLTLALLMGFGVRWLPVAFVAELLSGLLIFHIDDAFTTTQVILNAAVVVGPYAAAAYVLRRVIRIDTSLRDLRSLVWLLVIGVGLTPLLVAFCGVGMRFWAGADSGASYLDEVRTWWVGDAIGIASVTPAVLTIGAAVMGRLRPNLGRGTGRLQDALQAVIVLGAPWALWALQGEHHRLLFLTAVPVIWVAVTRGFLVTSVTVLYTNAATTAAAHWYGLGAVDMTDIQTSMLTLAIMSLGVAAATRELRRSRAQLAYRATHDDLTGLPNRRVYFERLHADLVEGLDVAVLFFDIDRVRIVGDSLGFEVIDRLLREIGERVERAVGPSCLVARYGGDEFAVLVSGPNVERRGRDTAERIVEVLRTPFQLEEHEVVAPATLGMAVGRGNADRLMRHADLARAEAKRRGEAWCAYREELGVRAEERQRLERQLRGAFRRSELAVVYQPIFGATTNDVVAVEALVRWNRPDRGTVSPEAFISVAEATGVIGEITRFVLDSACRRAVTWPITSPAGPPIVTVNVSVCQLGDEELLRDIVKALGDSGLEARRLAIEITESMALEDPDETVEFLHRLSALGVPLMIDDFGAGYSSLGHIHRLPVSVVKIDKMFAKDLAPGRPGEAVVASVVELAHGLDLKVTAEGIETVDQLTEAQRLGCDAVQGYGLSRPVEGDALEPLMQAKRPAYGTATRAGAAISGNTSSHTRRPSALT